MNYLHTYQHAIMSQRKFKLPSGICLHNGKYFGRCNHNGRTFTTRRYDSLEDAVVCFKEMKRQISEEPTIVLEEVEIPREKASSSSSKRPADEISEARRSALLRAIPEGYLKNLDAIQDTKKLCIALLERADELRTEVIDKEKELGGEGSEIKNTLIDLLGLKDEYVYLVGYHKVGLKDGTLGKAYPAFRIHRIMLNESDAKTLVDMYPTVNKQTRGTKKTRYIPLRISEWRDFHKEISILETSIDEEVERAHGELKKTTIAMHANYNMRL